MPPDELGFKPATMTGEDGAEDVGFPKAKQEIDEGLQKLETLLYSTVDKNFDKFEIYVLRNILSVPAELVNWVRLSHYEVGTLRRSCSRCQADQQHRACHTHLHQMRLRSTAYSYCGPDWRPKGMPLEPF